MKPIAYELIEPEDTPTEPVTLAEAKAHLKVDSDAEDTYIGDLITGAREFCEEHCGRSFVPQTWKLGFKAWPSPPSIWNAGSYRPEFDLHRPKVSAVVAVRYILAGETDFTDLATTRYTTELTMIPGVVRFPRGASLPSLNCDYAAPVQVEIVCCTADVEADPLVGLPTPARLKIAILQMVTQFYENRTPVISGTIASEVPLTALALLARLKIRKF